MNAIAWGGSRDTTTEGWYTKLPRLGPGPGRLADRRELWPHHCYRSGTSLSVSPYGPCNSEKPCTFPMSPFKSIFIRYYSFLRWVFEISPCTRESKSVIDLSQQIVASPLLSYHHRLVRRCPFCFSIAHVHNVFSRPNPKPL